MEENYTNLRELEVLKEKLRKATASYEKLTTRAKTQPDEEETVTKMMDLEEENFELNNKLEQLTAQKQKEEENLKKILPNREELQTQIAALKREQEKCQELNNIAKDRIGPLTERISQLNDEIEDCKDKGLRFAKEEERYTFEKMRNEILMETSEDRDKLRELNTKISSLYQRLDLQAESRIYDLAIQIGELQQKINTRDAFLRDLNVRKENNLNEQIANHTNKRLEELKIRIKGLQSKINALGNRSA